MRQSPENESDRSGRHVAVVRFSALGDVAMTIPVLYAACAENPDVQFTMITRRGMTGLFVNSPDNLTVKGVDLTTDYAGPGGMWRLAKEIDADILIDLHDVLRTKMLRTMLRLKGCRAIVFDKARELKRRFLKNPANCPAIRATWLRYADAFAKAGLKGGQHFKGLYAQTPADNSLFSALSAPKTAEDTWVGFAPFAAHRGKIYPPEYSKILCRMICNKKGYRLFLFGGGQSETDTLRAWAREAGKNAVCVAGSGIGMSGELALMANLDAMITMDSGNMHMAALAATPVVSIWGGTHPGTGFAPYPTCGSANTTIMQRDLGCRPCSVFGNKPCGKGNYECLEMPPQSIYEALCRILKTKTGK